MSDHEYMITVGPDWAEADTPEAALLAAHTLCNDLAAGAGAARMWRKEIIIVRNGMYDGPLTALAQEGRLSR